MSPVLTARVPSCFIRCLMVLLAVSGAPALRATGAQVLVGADSSTRLNRYGRDLVYGTALGLAFAGVDQWRTDPPQWGSGGSGYGKRAASDVGEFVIQETVTDILAAGMHRPLDYQLCKCDDGGERAGWALLGAVADPTPERGHVLAVPRIVGAFAGSFAQAAWRPTTGNRVNTALVNGVLSLAIGAGINLFYEFR